MKNNFNLTAEQVIQLRDDDFELILVSPTNKEKPFLVTTTGKTDSGRLGFMRLTKEEGEKGWKDTFKVFLWTSKIEELLEEYPMLYSVVPSKDVFSKVGDIIS